MQLVCEHKAQGLCWFEVMVKAAASICLPEKLCANSMETRESMLDQPTLRAVNMCRRDAKIFSKKHKRKKTTKRPEIQMRYPIHTNGHLARIQVLTKVREITKPVQSLVSTTLYGHKDNS